MWSPLRKREAAPQTREVAWPLGDLPDGALVREAKSGNASAFAELIDRYQDKIFTIINAQVQSREDALDLTQEVFIKAHRNLPKFREDCVFYTWLYRIALNGCIDFSRRRKRGQDPYSLDDEVLAEVGFEPTDERVAVDPTRSLENKALRDALNKAIQGLPETLRLAIVLHDIEGMAQKEIAEIMRCPLGTVKSRIQRARYELRARLLPYLDGNTP